MAEKNKGPIILGSVIAIGAATYLVMRARAVEEIKLSGLIISPAKVNLGDSVNISVLARNNTDVVLSRTIELGGDFMEQQIVTLEPGESDVVGFVVIPNAIQRYNVSVDGLTGHFDCVAEPIADIQLSNLIINPPSCYVGEEVLISVTATNHGQVAGSRTITLEVV